MLMAAYAVDMTVSNLFSAALPHLADTDVKGEAEAGQGVVEVEIHIEFAHLQNAGIHRPAAGIDLDRHAGAQPPLGDQMLDRHPLLAPLLTVPISLLRGQGHIDFIAGFPPREGFFESRKDVAMTVKVGDRLVTIGSFEGFLANFAQTVMEVDDLVVVDFHICCPAARWVVR